MRFSTLFEILKEVRKSVSQRRYNENLNKFEDLEKVNPASFDDDVADRIETYLNHREKFYSRSFAEIVNYKDDLINRHLEEHPETYKNFRNRYFNEGIADIVKKVYESNKILEYRNELIQHYDPIYQDPIAGSMLDFRTHFFSPVKKFFGYTFDTFSFNIVFVWILTVFLYVILYFDLVRKLVRISDILKRRK